MTLTVTLIWWVVPLALTLVSLSWAFFWPIDDGAGAFEGMARLLMVALALFVSLLAWALGGALK